MRYLLKPTAVLAALFVLTFVSSAAKITHLPATATEKDIQSALDGGGEVDLPAGKFIIHEPLILQRDGAALRGVGLDSALCLADNANCPVVILGPPVSPVRTPVKGVRLENLFIDGNRSQQSVELWRRMADGSVINNNGVEVRGTVGAVVSGVVCCRCRSGGLVTAAVNRKLTVQNFTSYDNQFDGLACYLTRDSDFSHLFLHDNRCAGISLDLGFDNNQVRDVVLTNNDLGIFMRQSFSNCFDGLVIRHSRHDGVFMAQSGCATAGGWRAFPATACVGNRFEQLVISDSGEKAFVINDASCVNNTVLDCQYAHNARGDLWQAPAPMLGAMLKR